MAHVNASPIKLAPKVVMVEVSIVIVQAETEEGSCDCENMLVERLLCCANHEGKQNRQEEMR